MENERNAIESRLSYYLAVLYADQDDSAQAEANFEEAVLKMDVVTLKMLEDLLLAGEE